MQITTLHTLAFSMVCISNEQQTAATHIIKGGASSIGVTAILSAQPMAEGADSASRGTTVHIQSESHDRCESYWMEVSRALAFIGVDATSP